MDYSSLIADGLSAQQIKDIYVDAHKGRFPCVELNRYLQALNEKIGFIESANIKEIEHLYSVFSRTSVLRECYNLGMEKRLQITRYNVRKPVTWDETTAYIYGYFIGDGCLHESRSANGGQMDISSSDEDMILKIRDVLNLGKIHNNSKESKKEYKSTKRIYWTDKDWYSFLLSMGIRTGKSKKDIIYVVPPDEYLWHFIRGLVDSDGTSSVYVHKGRMCYTWCIEGSVSFIEKLYSDVFSKTECKFSLSYDRKLRTICASSIETAIFLHEKLYNNPSIFMERKYNKLKEFIDVNKYNERV